MGGLDNVDRGILHRLQNDGRLSNSKLAEQLHISETPCWRRTKKLEEDGYIQGYQANLDRKKLGYGVLAFLQLTYLQHDPETTKAFEDMIHNCDNVLWCHNTTGEADFLLQVVAKDLDDYSRFIDEVIRKHSGISSIKSSISLRELKSSFKLPI